MGTSLCPGLPTLTVFMLRDVWVWRAQPACRLTLQPQVDEVLNATVLGLLQPEIMKYWFWRTAAH